MVAGQAAGCGEPVQGLGEEVAGELGDAEPAGVAAVAVVVEGEEGLGLGGAGLAAQEDGFVSVGEVVVEGGEHAAGGLPQPAGVVAASGAGAGAGGLGDQPFLGGPDLFGGGLGGGLFGGVEDHRDLFEA